MHKHIQQAEHNQGFHDAIETQFADKFTDWKITVLFYIAIHGLKALAAKKKIDIGSTHVEISKNINPDRHNAQMRIKKGAWIDYKRLFDYSQTARYNGISDMETFEQLKQLDYIHCKQHLSNFKKYLNNQGVQLKI